MLKAFLLIVVGLAGNPEHGELFHKWGASLAEASAKVGVTSDRLVYLVDQKGEGDKLATGRSTREEIQQAIDGFAKAASADDAVYVVLIGHGSYDGQTARFNLPGPDMNAADFNALVKRLPAKQLVFVNTSSSSGPFVEALSAPGRTIITATRSGAEQFATLFGGFFVDAFTSAEADQDKNQRVTMLEAFRFAKAGVTRAYEQEGLLATEHAMLDDNGDREGSQDPIGDRRRRQARGVAVTGVGRRRGAAARGSEAARVVSRAPRSRAPRGVAAAAEGQHAAGQVHRRTRTAGDRPGAEDARDSNDRRRAAALSRVENHRPSDRTRA